MPAPHNAPIFLAALLSLPVMAAGPLPDSYAMPNGNTGSYNYWDETYTGSGCVTCDGAALSGGRGDLVDGVVAGDNWFVVEAPPGNGPYVGWTVDPTITFRWNAPVTISSVTFHLDDADGNGGVNAPSSIVVGGQSFTVAEPAGSAPFDYTAGGLSFTGTELSVTLVRKNNWVFLSEVEFNATPVPEPAAAALWAFGLGAVGLLARRRNGG